MAVIVNLETLRSKLIEAEQSKFVDLIENHSNEDQTTIVLSTADHLPLKLEYVAAVSAHSRKPNKFVWHCQYSYDYQEIHPNFPFVFEKIDIID